jgi:hypothetical protein
MSALVGRSIGGKIRLHEGQVFLAEHDDDRPCKCCAFECEADLTISVSFCGMTVNATLEIPGVLDFAEATLPDGSYIILNAEISCTPCGWGLILGICAYCDSTEEFGSDAFTASVPFAASAEAGGGYCPETGAVALTCYGEQFGIPCVTTTTASIA